MEPYTEDFAASLPRSGGEMDGSDLSIAGINERGQALVSDGERSAWYEPMEGEAHLGSDLRIVTAYVEAGWFTEANCVTLTDGTHQAVYVPVPPEPG